MLSAWCINMVDTLGNAGDIATVSSSYVNNPRFVELELRLRSASSAEPERAKTAGLGRSLMQARQEHRVRQLQRDECILR